jgi:general secretion pathway protein J
MRPSRKPPPGGARCAATRRSGRGFTLLELLLATAVGAVVLIVIQTVFFSALRLHNTTHERIDSDLGIQRALGIVRRDLAGLMHPGGMLSGQLQTTNFSSTIGDSFGDRISPDIFTNSGKIDGWNPFAEVQMVAYFLAPSSTVAAGRDFVRVVTRNLLPVQETPGEPEVLLHGVNEATVEFCDGNGWTDEWDSEVMSALPTAIRLRLTLAASELDRPAAEPIELVVPVFVTTSASARAAAANMPEEILP